VLVLSPVFYGWLAASSSLFLFFFYNVTAGQLPWYGALSTSNLYTVWTPWSLWPRGDFADRTDRFLEKRDGHEFNGAERRITMIKSLGRQP